MKSVATTDNGIELIEESGQEKEGLAWWVEFPISSTIMAALFYFIFSYVGLEIHKLGDKAEYSAAGPFLVIPLFIIASLFVVCFIRDIEMFIQSDHLYNDLASYLSVYLTASFGTGILWWYVLLTHTSTDPKAWIWFIYWASAFFISTVIAFRAAAAQVDKADRWFYGFLIYALSMGFIAVTILIA
jgi:hypothetical protein